MPSALPPALPMIPAAGRNRPGLPHARNGFLSHLLATDPWLGVIVIIAIIIAGLMLALIKTTGRVLEGTPWYIRLALLVSAGLGITWLLGRNRRAGSDPRDTWRP